MAGGVATVDGGARAGRRRRPYQVALLVVLVAVSASLLVVLARPGGAPPRVRGDDYPYRVWSPQQTDPWGFASRSCASFVAWRLNQDVGRVEEPWAFDADDAGGRRLAAHLGNASTWDEIFAASGFRVDTSPARGSVAQWDADEEGTGVGCLGHVAYVADVYGDGSVLVEEYSTYTGFDARRTRAPRYIHVFDAH